MSAKLFAPRLRTANVPRTRILERLSTFRGVVLVSAPPGFGKTTLLAQWQRSDVRPFGWLTLDQSDNDPVVLWTYMKLAVESLLPQGGEASASSRPSRADPDVVVPELLSALEGLGVDVVLVLEDLHSITDPASLALLTQFLEGQPPNVTLALSARSDLYLPLGDLRVRLDLLELRATDLAFDIAEAERFLNGALDLALTSSAIDWLWNRTEGWPAGLYLAYLSLRESADPEAFVSRFQGSSRRIVEYLAEILDGQDARTRDFLVGSSILERMSGPLCDHVLATEGSAEVLESLERANLFVVSLDERREWYRYHRLFLELLRDELHRRRPESIAELHRRASEWFRDNHEDAGEAIRHALAARDREGAIVLLAENYLRTLEWGGLSTLERWLTMFPRADIVADARLSVVEAWVMSFLTRYREADLAMENALRAGYRGPLPDGAGSVEASAVLIRASAPRGDVGDMLRAARKAFELEGGAASMWQVTAHTQLGWALLLCGDVTEAVPLLERAAAQAVMTEQWLNAFGSRCLLAWAAIADKRLGDAERWALDARSVQANSLRRKAAAAWAGATLGAVRAAQKRFDEAGELFDEAIPSMRATSPPLLLAQALVAFAPVRRMQGAPAEAHELLAEARAIVDRCTDPGTIGEQLERVARSLTPRHRRVRAAPSPLTERELEVLALLEKGLSKREIARALYLSYNTVHTHTKSIYRKLGVDSRADAVQRARQEILPGRRTSSP